MVRITACLGMLFILAVIYFWHSDSDRSASLELEYRYLVVSVDASSEWKDRHTVSIVWEGKRVTLPLAFRLPGSVDNIRLGAGPETSRVLHVGTKDIPVEVDPPTEIRVGNQPGVALLTERVIHGDKAIISVTTEVSVWPDQAAPPHPMPESAAEILEAGDPLNKRLAQLLSEGRVIELEKVP
jgi:hypothetical protein